MTPAGALAASVKGDGKADKDSNVAAWPFPIDAPKGTRAAARK